MRRGEGAGRRETVSKKKQTNKKKIKERKTNYKYHTILFPQLTGESEWWRNGFHVFFKNRWGRGQPDDIGAMNLGDEKFDPDSDKKPRAGQILWIRGLTRLQTQVTIPISFSFFLSKSRTLFLYSILSIYLCLSIYLYLISLISHRSRSIFSSPFSQNRKRKKKKIILSTATDPAGSERRPHELLFNFNF